MTDDSYQHWLTIFLSLSGALSLSFAFGLEMGLLEVAASLSQPTLLPWSPSCLLIALPLIAIEAAGATSADYSFKLVRLFVSDACMLLAKSASWFGWVGSNWIG